MTFEELNPTFRTVSHRPLLVGTGSGTKWKKLKEADVSNSKVIENQMKLAIENGFYHLDTAESYNTDVEVGSAINSSSIERKDFWITHKYSPTTLTSGPIEALSQGLKNLQTEYVDLYLIHENKFKPSQTKNNQTLESAWEEMIELQKRGLARYIGVSNFKVDALETIIKISEKHGSEYYPRVNQIEFHPYLQNSFPGIYKFCQDNNILIEAYAPLAPLSLQGDHPLAAILPKLAAKYGKTAAQILLRWTWQMNVLPVTTSSKQERIKQSLDIYNFKLDNEDVEFIANTGFEHRAFTFVLEY